MSQDKLKLLITGAEGFIGKHVVRVAKARGHDVTAMDFKYGQHISQYDVPSYDAVIHLAAFIDIQESFEHPWMYIDNNIGTLKFLSDARRVVFASSAAVYGNFSPYGDTKRLGEVLLPKNSVSLRLFNPFGPGDKTHIISLLAKASRAEKKLTLYANGESIRDYIHVEDVAEAFVLSAESDITGPYQLGNTHLSLKQVADLMGVEYKLSRELRFKGEEGVLMSNGSIELRRDLNWEPKHDVKEEIKNWRNWYEEA